MDSHIRIYEDSEKGLQVEVKLQAETLWLTQQQIADLFGTRRQAITKHLKNIFSSGELEEGAVCSILERAVAYDNGEITTGTGQNTIPYGPLYEDARQAIDELKNNLFGTEKEKFPMFGKEKDQGLKAILGTVVQSFGGQYLYPTLEEQAANLLYLVVKNHPFADGNKRIG